jgi:hypothetical protein
MSMIPVFFSRTQLEDVSAEINRQIRILDKHLDAQVGTYGAECCETEIEWRKSLQGATAAIAVALVTYKMVNKESNIEPSIIEKAQLRIRHLQNKGGNFGLPSTKGGLC